MSATREPQSSPQPVRYPPGCDPRRTAAENGTDSGRYTARRDWPHIGDTMRLIEGDGAYTRHLAAWSYRYTPWPLGAGPDVVAYTGEWASHFIAGYLSQIHDNVAYLLGALDARETERARVLAARRVATPTRPVTPWREGVGDAR